MTPVRTVLVTGSLGYLGSRLTPYLTAYGVRCIGYDTGFFRACTLIPTDDAPARLADARDFRDEDLHGVDAVVHLAGISNDPLGMLSAARLYDPTRDYALAIAEQCKRLGVRFVFASSCSIYGIGQEPLVTENSAAAPQTPYSRNKLEIEQGLQALADATFCPIVLRLATVYGPSSRMRFDLVVNMLVGMALARRQIILNSNGQAWRPHVHIEDVCETICRCLAREFPCDGRALVMNVGRTDQNLRILDVAELVRAQVRGCEVQFLNGADARDPNLELVRDRKIQDGVDVRTYRVSFDRLEHILEGFRCRWTLEDGIRAMIREFTQLGVTEAQFQDTRFYRLQWLEALVAGGELSADLRWRSGALVETDAPEPVGGGH